jgi:hypothetical protein
VCTSCDTHPAVNIEPNFYVDPQNGNDDGGSGIMSPASCSFKTITQAIKAALLTPGLDGGHPAIIHLLSDTKTSGAPDGEKFPIAVPSNIHIVGATNGTQVLPPPNASAFQINGSNVTISTLTIKTDPNVAPTAGKPAKFLRGIIVNGSASQTGVSVDHVSITNSWDAGVHIASTATAAVTLGPALTVSNAGKDNTGALPSSIVIDTGGDVAITGDGGQTLVSGGAGHAIEVLGAGKLTIATGLNPTGNPTQDFTTAPVVAKANGLAGVFVHQTATGASTNSAAWMMQPTVTLNGMVVIGSVGGQGAFHFEGGSKVTLRNSVAYGNAGSGAFITNSAASSPVDDDPWVFTSIDLGSKPMGDPAGKNILQVPAPAAGGTVTPNSRSPRKATCSSTSVTIRSTAAARTRCSSRSPASARPTTRRASSRLRRA